MNGEVYTRDQLEDMDSWRATFRYIIAHASPLDRVVCLMKNSGKKPGFLWKMPGMFSAEPADLAKLRIEISEKRLELVRGHLPRGVMLNAVNSSKQHFSKRKKKFKV